MRGIELGKKSWADDSQLIESAILTKYILKGSASKSLAYKSGGKAAGKQSDEDRTWFCFSYQRNKCTKKIKSFGYNKWSNAAYVTHLCYMLAERQSKTGTSRVLFSLPSCQPLTKKRTVLQ